MHFIAFLDSFTCKEAESVFRIQNGGLELPEFLLFESIIFGILPSNLSN